MNFRKDHAMKGCEAMGILVPRLSQNTEKDRK